MTKTYFIIYVEDQEKTKLFYELLFNKEPILDEPGMTEFELPDGSILGVMPIESIQKLFGSDFTNTHERKSLPQTEFYIIVENAIELHKRAIQLGATEIRKFDMMDWGDKVAYSINHDGHILAFAERE